jgi:uncharacterized membrane protein
MNVVTWLSVVGAIVAIIAFLFAVWVWIKSDTKIRELERVIQTTYDVTGVIKWEMQTIAAEDSSARLRNAENSLGAVSALHVMTGKYAKNADNIQETEIGALVERGVIWSINMLNQLEGSPQVQEVWLVTPDLEPDLSHPTTGKLVANNLKNRKPYVYFCPSDLRDLETKIKRLMANIGALRTQESSRVTVVPISPTRQGRIFQRGNIVIFYKQDPDWGTFIAFEEVVFTRISERGAFWQEHTPEVAAEIRANLKEELENWRVSRRSPPGSS